MSIKSYAQLNEKFIQKEGFEDCFPCNIEAKLPFCKSWEDTPWSHVFLYSNCNNQIPQNPQGFQFAHEGSSYAGVLLLRDIRHQYFKEGGNKTTFHMREYLRLKLQAPLVEGKTYSFSCYVSLSDKSAFGIGHLSIDVSQSRIKPAYKFYSSLRSSKPIPLKGKYSIDNRVDWVKIGAQFTARGKERFITVGLFSNEIKYSYYKKLIKNSPSNTNGCFYYIDDVEIKEL